jgi:hypothetical protein
VEGDDGDVEFSVPVFVLAPPIAVVPSVESPDKTIIGIVGTIVCTSVIDPPTELAGGFVEPRYVLPLLPLLPFAGVFAADPKRVIGRTT